MFQAKNIYSAQAVKGALKQWHDNIYNTDRPRRSVLRCSVIFYIRHASSMHLVFKGLVSANKTLQSHVHKMNIGLMLGL